MIPELFTKYNLRKEFPSTDDIIGTTDDSITDNSIKKVMDEDQKKKIFNSYKTIYKGGQMQKLMKHIELDTDSVDIAGEFSINKKGDKRSRDTIPITNLKRAYKKVKDKL